MILRLDPDDDEAEGAEIARAAAAGQPSVEQQLALQRSYLIDGTPDVEELRRRAAQIPEGEFQEALAGFLRESASLGVQASVRGLHRIGIGFNYQLANARVAGWARAYSYGLVGGINETTRQRLADEISAWVERAETFPDLVNRLAPVFGSERAELIASTEATRAYAEGTFAGYEQAGFARRPAESERPPGHPRCRCWVAVQQEEDGSWNYVWLTANDEIVERCPICWPKHGQVIGPAGRI
jgi:hypothetical protein